MTLHAYERILTPDSTLLVFLSPATPTPSPRARLAGVKCE